MCNSGMILNGLANVSIWAFTNQKKEGMLLIQGGLLIVEISDHHFGDQFFFGVGNEIWMVRQ